MHTINFFAAKKQIKMHFLIPLQNRGNSSFQSIQLLQSFNHQPPRPTFAPMSQSEWFANWFNSPYYHQLYQHRNQEEAASFIDNLLHYLQPPAGSSMIDIACGEGRHALSLAEKGYEVAGIDLATASIQKARQYQLPNLSFYVQDMRLPFYINYFDYAFNFFTSFGYFDSPRDHQAAAHQFANCLKPGGTLVIDYLNEVKSRKELVPEETVQRDERTFHIKRFIDEGYFIKEICFEDAEGKSRHYQERVAAFGLKDFERLFGNSGLSLKQTFGDYALGAFDAARSPRLILIFEKKTHGLPPA